ncbi:MAG TPA: M28 family metallopeptidase [Gemmatimonadales bacterium]|jgi:hypothetical protein
MRRLPFAALVLLATAAPLPAQNPYSGHHGPRAAAAGSSDPRLRAIVRSADPRRLEADDRQLVAFGTRHTLSDTLSPIRGIGAARRWIHARFDSLSADCGGCLDVQYVGDMVGPTARIPTATNVVSVVAIQRGSSDTSRVIVMTGHFDSRNSQANNATDSAPGANDDGSGTVAVLEAARILSKYKFAATIIYATLAGEEQGLNGGQIVARWVQHNGWRVEGNLNNDIDGNTNGGDGVRNDDRTIRVFSDGVPPTETDSQRLRRRSTGGEVDGISRQLARYVQQIGRQHLDGADVWLVYRLDRFGRGGDHRAFADLGFPAVRITEAHENYTRQHQTPRTEHDTLYGDEPEGVNFRYLAKVAALNAASLASLAWAPAPPRTVRVTGAGQYAAQLTWQAPDDSADVAKYRVYWRRTDSPTWDNFEDVGLSTRYAATGRVIDNFFFGVASVSREGHESVIVFQGGN